MARLSLLAAAAACLVLGATGQMLGTSCWKRIPLNGVCLSSLRPGAGNDPERNAWCEDNTFCDQKTRKCSALPSVNKTCGNGVMCGAGLGCNTDPMGLTMCIDLRTDKSADSSALMGPSGEPTECAAGFGSYDVGGSWKCRNVIKMSSTNKSPCTFDLRCAAGFTCGFYSDIGLGNVCNKAKTKGQPCTREGECAAGLWCGNNVCVNKINTDTACTDDVQCVDWRFCAKKLLWPFSKVCRLPLPALGQACTGGNGKGRCDKTSTGVQLVCRIIVV
jgi:hypothetical protein